MKTLLKLPLDLLHALAMVLATLFAALAVASLGGVFSDRLDVLTHFTPIWLAGLVLALAAWAISGRKGRTIPLLAGVGLLAAFSLMAPDLLAVARPGSAEAAADRLTVLQFNLWGRNRDPAGTARWILDTNPDIIIIEEGVNGSGGIVKALARRYPHRTTCAEPRSCSTLILAKRRPVAEGGLASSTALPGAWATFADRRGAPFTVVGVHYTWPWPAGPQQQQTRRLAAALTAFPKDRMIVAGDFNSTPWSFSLRRQDRLFGLERRTRALASWPAGDVSRLHVAAPFPLLPIDQVYAGRGWRTVAVRRGPLLGSDHYPVLVTLAAAP